MMLHRTIEDRLEEIETEVHDIKTMLLKLFTLNTKETKNKSEETLMNVKDVANFAGVEPPMIYAACNKGQIQFIKIGKLYKFKKEEVLKWIEGEKHISQNEKAEIDVDAYVENYLQQNRLHG
jgi:excisionase family DNA binding protein